MKSYRLSVKEDGTIEFWTNDEELRERVGAIIEDIADAISFRRHIRRIDKLFAEEEE